MDESKLETTAEVTVETVQEKNYEVEYKTLEDKYIRLYSDFENYKKRVIKEKEENSLNIKRNVLGSILPTIDDIDRVISSTVIDIEGLKIINHSFIKNLTDHGLEKINSIGEKFNPDIHEAIATIAKPETDKGIIVDELTTGYLLNGKLIRPSKVVVAQ